MTLSPGHLSPWTQTDTQDSEVDMSSTFPAHSIRIIFTFVLSIPPSFLPSFRPDRVSTTTRQGLVVASKAEVTSLFHCVYSSVHFHLSKVTHQKY
jgi:hypothetical protein